MNSLTRLELSGWKTIKCLSELALAPLNVLIGANGAGKSNLSSFFRLLNWMDNLLGRYLRFSFADYNRIPGLGLLATLLLLLLVGSIATWMGIASAAIRNEKIFSRPANRSFANAYPAIELKSSEPPVT